VDEILGLRPTGREIRDPAARLLEATDDNGRYYTVLHFDEAHRGHAALTLNVELVLSFMQFPMVTGLVGLAKHDLEQGAFAFETGSVWTLAEVHRAFSDFGKVVGLRAGLELAWLASQVLVEAGETGPMQGCFSHGNVSPTRLALRADGMVQVFGHGLAQVEVLRHRQEGFPLEPTSLYCCPPERLEGVPEDPAADTYSLTLVVYELITGKPLLDTHDLDELTRMVGMSEGATLLSRSNAGLPPKVAKTFARSLIYDPDTRLSGQDYVDAIGQLLANESLEGPSLSEVVKTLQGQAEDARPRGRKLVATKSTTAFTPEMLRQMAEEADDEEDDDEASASPRWKKVDRSRKGGGADDSGDEQATPAASEEDEPPKRSRRKRRRAPTAEAEADKPAASSSRRRRRRSPEPEPEPASTEPEEAAPEAPAERPRRRTRRSPEEASMAEAAPATAQQASAEEPSASEESPRRRRRRAPAASEAEPASEAEEPSPRRRRRSRDDDDDDDARPRRRRTRSTEDDDDTPSRRRRKKPAEEPASSDDEEPAPRRRRRRKAPTD
jgi:hypothetical protein